MRKVVLLLSVLVCLPLLANAVNDHRQGVAPALGWVLREMDRVYPDQVTRFLCRHGPRMSAVAIARAIERRPPGEREGLRRKQGPRSA